MVQICYLSVLGLTNLHHALLNTNVSCTANDASKLVGDRVQTIWLDFLLVVVSNLTSRIAANRITHIRSSSIIGSFQIVGDVNFILIFISLFLGKVNVFSQVHFILHKLISNESAVRARTMVHHSRALNHFFTPLTIDSLLVFLILIIVFMDKSTVTRLFFLGLSGCFFRFKEIHYVHLLKIVTYVSTSRRYVAIYSLGYSVES